MPRERSAYLERYTAAIAEGLSCARGWQRLAAVPARLSDGDSLARRRSFRRPWNSSSRYPKNCATPWSAGGNAPAPGRSSRIATALCPMRIVHSCRASLRPANSPPRRCSQDPAALRLRSPGGASRRIHEAQVASARAPIGAERGACFSCASGAGAKWCASHGAILRERAAVTETLQAVSDLADATIRAAVAAAERHLLPIFGEPQRSNPAQSPFIVLGMGKLGGARAQFFLGYRSDISVHRGRRDQRTAGGRQRGIFQSPGTGSHPLARHAQRGWICVSRRHAAAALRRSGPLVVSLASLEDYLQQHGRDWERYAWIKARAIVGADAYAPPTRNSCVPSSTGAIWTSAYSSRCAT